MVKRTERRRLSALKWLLWVSLCCSISCAEEIPPALPPIIEYPIYQGELIVENRSQFEFLELYIHDEADQPLSLEESLLASPLLPGDEVTIEVKSRQYLTAVRPRVRGGPRWRIKSDQPVTFYREEGGPQPRLWLLDQGFMVIDPQP